MTLLKIVFLWGLVMPSVTLQMSRKPHPNLWEAGGEVGRYAWEDQFAAISGDGVWMLEGTASHSFARKNKDALPVQDKGRYGFYMHTFSDAAACVHLLREVRRVYPEGPVYIMSDGGRDFSAICAEIGNCNFQWRPPANDRWNPMPFFNRFRKAAWWLRTKYVIMLEPDNQLQNKMSEEPEVDADAGGLKDENPAFGGDLVKYMESKARIASGNSSYKLKWHQFGLAGGSFFRTDAVLHAFDPKKMDWPEVRRLGGKRVWSSDVAMPIALAVHGYSYYPSGVTQKRYGMDPKAAWRHYGRDEGIKPYYDTQLNKADQHLVTVHDGPVGGSVTCQGCVWVADDVCFAKQPPTCPTTSHDDQHPPGPWTKQ